MNKVAVDKIGERCRDRMSSTRVPRPSDSAEQAGSSSQDIRGLVSDAVREALDGYGFGPSGGNVAGRAGSPCISRGSTVHFLLTSTDKAYIRKGFVKS